MFDRSKFLISAKCGLSSASKLFLFIYLFFF